MSNLPPGLYAGTSYSAVKVECDRGHEWIQHLTRELDTGAAYSPANEEVCPVCGGDPTAETDQLEEDDGPDPDQAYDEMRERQMAGEDW